eukprot:6277419-Amphidinium_carterae.1
MICNDKTKTDFHIFNDIIRYLVKPELDVARKIASRPQPTTPTTSFELLCLARPKILAKQNLSANQRAITT